ncbi:amino acid racemase [Aureisphaera galaxeae]|uniref:aspartate/glutamate racemase family protein n=1 Tax=Aureisphaera galaxeae TaxID=1538023 RepID=UPI002350586C|nr:amino acid racemase [Aureisphaera galaxeae]MDC8004729.1 amino acid racemase [Aureisphaera galaxeae]
MSKKTLGIISGMGTKAGLLFVNKLVDRIEAPTDQDFPEFVIHNNSKIPDRTLSIVYGEESPYLELFRSIKMLQACNVSFIVSTCVTSYHEISRLEKQFDVEILNPVDLVLNLLKTKYKHYRRIGLLATSGTLKSGLFHRKFKHSGLELITLNERDQEEEFMKAVYMEGGFKSSHVVPEAYDHFKEAVSSLNEKGVDVIIGGCTEVQIGFDKLQPKIPYIDVIDVLIDEVIKRMNLKRKVEHMESLYF